MSSMVRTARTCQDQHCCLKHELCPSLQRTARHCEYERVTEESLDGTIEELGIL
ncbi:hypothetical protein CPB85DRAFT_159765 [Mucidula mucida]|nr:hypothetical protein CPB85DRAFT_159765 [Mucidula mucida]